MSLWLLFPLVAAFIGWLIASIFVSRLPALVNNRKQALAERLIKMISGQLFLDAQLEERLASTESFQKILPTIEEHIDEFLRHKLGKSMPFLSMFVGDKTINQLKGLFMAELAVIFPQVMKKYIGQLQQEIDLEGVLHAKLAAIPSERITSGIRELLANELRLMKMMGAVIGFAVGLIQVVLLALTTVMS